MTRRWLVAISLLSVPVGAQTENKVDIGGLLEKKPCDDDKKKPEGTAAQPPAPKPEAPLQGFLETPPAEKKPEQKSLGAVPAMGNCK
ncbi:hypothetical protein [Oligoflexus tunisiensis]|uniref:hypothetical protein n=1 Tax=Oligoflexus tunisiensis TaxID=708132 RepID=UPI00114CCCCE|nr:hypothetical protein [Oligoflexus tunisiensis]